MDFTPTPPPVAADVSGAGDRASLAFIEPAPDSRVQKRIGTLLTATAVLAGFLIVVIASATRPSFIAMAHRFARYVPEVVTKAIPKAALGPFEDNALPGATKAGGSNGEAANAAIATIEEPTPNDGLNREGHGSIPGGVLFVPSTFHSEDGSYDLLLHFHGNTAIVKESAEFAKLNAIVAVVNLGTGSAPYEHAYEMPMSYETFLERINHTVEQRGLANAHLRRLALSSWSAGYGAISTIVDQRKGTDPLDAILVLDGIHVGFLEDPSGAEKKMNVLNLAPFVKAAEMAAHDQILFTITHSEIDPGDYAGTNLTASYLLERVHGVRGLPTTWPAHIELPSADGTVSKKLEKTMDPFSEALVGHFHVRGFRGNTPEHHMAHLLQMGATVLPELVDRRKTLPSSQK